MTTTVNSLISIENLFQAWEEFKKGKGNKRDVQIFERRLEDNLFELFQKLKNRTYKHGPYSEFYVNDPKRRHIHKAGVSDRIIHHLLYKYLYEIFDKTFIFDSYSCRLNKGTHKAVNRLDHFSKSVSKNYTQQCWALKLDIRQFFASVDHKILISLIEHKVKDQNILCLIKEVIESYSSNDSEKNKLSYSSSESEERIEKSQEISSRQARTISDIGIPLGNLTSQIFANIYLNDLDQFTKQKLRVKNYLRYADDFLILDQNYELLLDYFKALKYFLEDELNLEIHPNKVFFRKFSWGIDFCGYVVLPHYILPRTKTKRRIFKKVNSQPVSNQSLQSYLGYLSHASSFRNSQNLKNAYSFYTFDTFDTFDTFLGLTPLSTHAILSANSDYCSSDSENSFFTSHGVYPEFYRRVRRIRELVLLTSSSLTRLRSKNN